MSYKVGIFIAKFALMEVSNILRQKPNKSILTPYLFEDPPLYHIFSDLKLFIY